MFTRLHAQNNVSKLKTTKAALTLLCLSFRPGELFRYDFLLLSKVHTPRDTNMTQETILQNNELQWSHSETGNRHKCRKASTFKFITP